MEVNDMLQYLIYRDGFPSTELERLGIEFSPWEDPASWMVSPSGVRSLIEKGYRFDTQRTGFDGMTALVLVRRPDTDPRIPDWLQVERRWPGEMDKYFIFDLIKEHIYPLVDKPITIRFGDTRSAPATENFTIHICSSPTQGEITIPERLKFEGSYHRHHADTYCAFAEWDDGLPMVDEDNQEYGAVDKHNMYIYPHLTRCSCEQGIAIARFIMARAADYIKLAQEGKSRMDVMGDLVRSRYAHYCSQRLTREREQISHALRDGEEMVRRLQRDLVETIRKRDEDQARMNYLDNASGEVDHGEEFDKLLDLAHIIKATISGDTLIVETDMIKATDPRTEVVHLVGRVKISIRMSSGYVNIRNLSWLVNNMNAPHVFNNGEPCLGNIGSILPELVGRYDFAAALMVIIQYLESINVNDSAGVKAHYWPIDPEYAAEKGIEQKVWHRYITESGDKVLVTHKEETIKDLMVKGGYADEYQGPAREDYEDDDEDEDENY